MGRRGSDPLGVRIDSPPYREGPFMPRARRHAVVRVVPQHAYLSYARAHPYPRLRSCNTCLIHVPVGPLQCRIRVNCVRRAAERGPA